MTKRNKYQKRSKSCRADLPSAQPRVATPYGCMDVEATLQAICRSPSALHSSCENHSFLAHSRELHDQNPPEYWKLQATVRAMVQGEHPSTDRMLLFCSYTSFRCDMHMAVQLQAASDRRESLAEVEIRLVQEISAKDEKLVPSSSRGLHPFHFYKNTEIACRPLQVSNVDHTNKIDP